MSDQQILKYCSPALAGIKTGNLFSCRFCSRKEIRDDLIRLNRILRPKGLRAVPLRYTEERVLIYIYRVSSLRRDIEDPECADILRDHSENFPENKKRDV